MSYITRCDDNNNFSRYGAKGQKIYAKKHTQDEWTKIKKDITLKDKIRSICKNAYVEKIKDKYIPELSDFTINFASDSGNIPSC